MRYVLCCALLVVDLFWQQACSRKGSIDENKPGAVAEAKRENDPNRAPAASPPAMMMRAEPIAEAVINGKDVAIYYSLRRRVKLGELLNEDAAAIRISSEGDLIVGGRELKAGRYWLKLQETGGDNWVLAFCPQGSAKVVLAELPLKLEPAVATEEFTITLTSENSTGVLRIQATDGALNGAFSVK
jgi:hypothetical protein